MLLLTLLNSLIQYYSYSEISISVVCTIAKLNIQPSVSYTGTKVLTTESTCYKLPIITVQPSELAALAHHLLSVTINTWLPLSSSLQITHLDWECIILSLPVRLHSLFCESHEDGSLLEHLCPMTLEADPEIWWGLHLVSYLVSFYSTRGRWILTFWFWLPKTKNSSSYLFIYALIIS